MAHAGAPKMFGGVGEERQVTGPLDRVRERALVLGAGAGPAPRFDAATIRDESAQKADVLVVDNFDLVGAHDAYPAPATHPAPRPLLITSGRARSLEARSVWTTFRTARRSGRILDRCVADGRRRLDLVVSRCVVISLCHLSPIT